MPGCCCPGSHVCIAISADHSASAACRCLLQWRLPVLGSHGGSQVSICCLARLVLHVSGQILLYDIWPERDCEATALAVQVPRGLPVHGSGHLLHSVGGSSRAIPSDSLLRKAADVASVILRCSFPCTTAYITSSRKLTATAHFAMQVASTRWMLQDEMHIANTQCGELMVQLGGCMPRRCDRVGHCCLLSSAEFTDSAAQQTHNGTWQSVVHLLLILIVFCDPVTDNCLIGTAFFCAYLSWYASGPRHSWSCDLHKPLPGHVNTHLWCTTSASIARLTCLTGMDACVWPGAHWWRSASVAASATSSRASRKWARSTCWPTSFRRSRS